MNTVLTLYDRPEEWYQDTYVCCECKTEFMTDDIPKFCPCCGVKFDAIRIHYGTEHGNRTVTEFINDEQEVTNESKS